VALWVILVALAEHHQLKDHLLHYSVPQVVRVAAGVKVILILVEQVEQQAQELHQMVIRDQPELQLTDLGCRLVVKALAQVPVVQEDLQDYFQPLVDQAEQVLVVVADQVQDLVPMMSKHQPVQVVLVELQFHIAQLRSQYLQPQVVGNRSSVVG
jgi:hypothetical protein